MNPTELETGQLAMQCVILAGGRGSRMRPVTDRVPKTLLPVLGVPFAHYQLTRLAAEGVGRVVYALGHLGRQVVDFVGDGSRWGLDVTYAHEGDTLLGTGGALRQTVDLGLAGERFLVLYGDSYLTAPIGPVWAAGGDSDDPLMTVFRNAGRWDKSNVVFDGARVVLYEKGRADAEAMGMRHIDYGLSVLSADFVRAEIAAGAVTDLAAVFHKASREGRLRGHEVGERFYEIGSREGLSALEGFLSKAPEAGGDG